MKVCMLAPANSIHTVRWATSIARKGVEVRILSLHPGSIQGVEVVNLAPPTRLLGKLGYLSVAQRAREQLRLFEPDVLHAHYASSYGALGAAVGFRPFAITAWGSDIFAFPRCSPFHSGLLSLILSRADATYAISRAMQAEMQKYSAQVPSIIPFGIDTARFTPVDQRPAGTRRFVVGATKGFEPVYGIDDVIEGFALAHPELTAMGLEPQLVLVGQGSLEQKLRSLVNERHLNSAVSFPGWLPHDQVAEALRGFDVFVNVSYSEGFGVAVLEASASGLPVISSRVGGLTDTVAEGVTGLFVPPGNPAAIAKALLQLARDPALRAQMGRQGRAFVQERFEWDASVESMLGEYHRLASEHGRPRRTLPSA